MTGGGAADRTPAEFGKAIIFWTNTTFLEQKQLSSGLENGCKKSRFLRFLKNLTNLKSPKFRFLNYLIRVSFVSL